MSRVVIWTIVGIVVVLGVIFIVTTRRQARETVAIKPLSDEAYTSYMHRMDRMINNFNNRIARVKAKHPSPTPEIQTMLNELDTEMTAFIAAVQDLQGRTTTQAREEGYTIVQEKIKRIRKMIRDLGGTTTQTE